MHGFDIGVRKPAMGTASKIQPLAVSIKKSRDPNLDTASKTQPLAFSTKMSRNLR